MENLDDYNVWIGNPFDVDLIARRLSASRLLNKRDVTRDFRDLIKKDRDEDAATYLLAVTHWQICNNAEMTLIESKNIKAEDFKSLPHTKNEYRRILHAARRAYKAIFKLYGRSMAMYSVRKQTWASCFGETLHDAILYRDIIREQNVCLLGETGTGKELIARAISDASITDEEEPIFNAVDIAAFSETVIESELFGHVKGAYTGATHKRDGWILKSNNGVIFLDEVGNLPVTTQVKILRVIQEGELKPVGSDESIKVSVRFVAGTNKNLEDMMIGGQFRRDLYHRIAGTIIETTPLRDRPEDIEDIVTAFIKRQAPNSVAGPEGVMKRLKELGLLSYHWPGNVRDLQNVVRNILLNLPINMLDHRSHNEQDTKDLAVQEAGDIPNSIIKKEWTLEQVEKWYVNFIYRDSDNKSESARRLGINRGTLERWIKKNGKT